MRVWILGLMMAAWSVSGTPVTLPDGAGQLRFSCDEQELQLRQAGDGVWRSGDMEFQISTETITDGHAMRLTATVPGGVYRLVVTLENELTAGNNAVTFFDGARKTTLETQPLSRTDPFDVFPLASVFTAEQGIALGLTPDSVVGDFSSEARLENGDATLAFSAQMVLDNRKPQQLGLVSLRYKPEFGWRNALESYYQSFPAWFRLTPGINPAIYGVGGYYLSAHSQYPFELHGGRKSGLNWEWTYAPWIEAGNWYTEPEEWVDGESEILNFHAYREHKRGSYDEFHDVITRQFDSGSRRAAMYFYILVKDMMKSLGDRYPEALFVDENGRRGNPSGLYSLVSNAGKTYMTFAPGSGLIPHLERKLKLCVANYDIDGFAFDMANFAVRNYGESQLNYAVGRAFDEEGKIYTPDSILPVYFADYIHTLARDGVPMSVYMNMALEQQSAIGVFHADGVMFEGNPEAEINHILTLRMMAGRKPMTFFAGVGMGEMTHVIDWGRAAAPEVKTTVYRGLAQLLLLKCLEYGVTPMNWAVLYDNGDFFKPHLQSLIALKKAGWNPVPAIRSEAGSALWYGRFGYGDDTILTISNPQRESITTEVEIVTGYFGVGGPWLAVPHQGQKLPQSVRDGVIRFPLTLGPKEFVLLTVMPVGADDFEAEVSGDYRNITVTGDVQVTPHAFLPDGSVLAAQSKDGMTQNFRYERPELILPDEAAVATVFTEADQRDNPEPAQLVLPERQSRDLETVAILVDRYYPYCEASRRYCGRPWTQEAGFLDAGLAVKDPLPVVKARDSERKAIYIGTGADFPELEKALPEEFRERAQRYRGGWLIAPDAGTLWIGGNTDAEVMQAGERYFELLDERQK